MSSKVAAVAAGTLIVAALSGVTFYLLTPHLADTPDIGALGGPIKGITVDEYKAFREGKAIFEHDFKIEDGLGPVFNRRSCASCHGRPDIIGGDGREKNTTMVLRVARRNPLGVSKYKLVADGLSSDTSEEIDTLDNLGGPVLDNRSVVVENPKQFPPGTVYTPTGTPSAAEFFSFRHSPQLFGAGLIEAIPDSTLLALEEKQMRDHGGKPFGKAVRTENPLSHGNSVGRFGWKAQHPSVFSFSAEAMLIELGLTNPLHPIPKSREGFGNVPEPILKALPPDPNDKEGAMLFKLATYISMLAPPKSSPKNESARRGETAFNQIGCAECHVPELRTFEKVFIPARDVCHPMEVSFDEPARANTEKPIRKIENIPSIEVKALENQPVRAYSDFLVHDMGPKLADGIAQNNALGGEWRTAPLWGLGRRHYFLHDARATTLEQAIEAHAGQAAHAVDGYHKLSGTTRTDLITFLKSL